MLLDFEFGHVYFQRALRQQQLWRTRDRLTSVCNANGAGREVNACDVLNSYKRPSESVERPIPKPAITGRALL